MADDPRSETTTSKQETPTTPTEKQEEGRKDTEKELSGKELTEKEGKEMTERSEKEGSRVSKKSGGSSRSKGSRRGSKSKSPAKKDRTKETSEIKAGKEKKAKAEASASASESQISETRKSGKKKRKGRSSEPQISAKEEPTAGVSASKKKKSTHALPPEPAKPAERAPEQPVPQIANLTGMDFNSLRVMAMGGLLAVGGIVIILTYMGVLRHKEVLRDQPCVSVECQKVVRLTESFMDHSVSPCRDFYRHVCGHWMRDSRHPSSFMIDVARNLTDVWYQAFTKDYTTGDYHELRQGAALFYRSCLTFLAQQTDIAAAAQELFKALNLSVSKWLAETSYKHFFHSVLYLSLVSRFPTLLSIDATISETNKTLQIRRWPPFHALVRPMYHDQLSEYMRNAVKVIGKEQASDVVIKEVLSLDITRAKRAILDDTSEQRLDDTRCRGFAAKFWRKVLEKDLSLPEQVTITIVQPDAICKDLNAVLVNTRSVARPVYILSLVVGHILKYDYELSKNRAAEAINNVCYMATAEAHEDIWLHLMSSFLYINKEIEVAFDAYINFIAASMKIAVRSRSWMSERDRSATLGKLSRIHTSRFYGADMTEQAVECYSSKQIKVDGFVSNMVALRTRDVKKCLFVPGINISGYNDRRILMGRGIFTDPVSLRVYVPASFAVAPLYYRRVNGDKFVNIAVVVMHMARKVLALLDRKTFNPAMTTAGGIAPADNKTTDAGSHWNVSTLANYSSMQRCYSRVSRSFHEHLRDDQFDDAFSVVEAMRLAHDAKCAYDRRIVAKKKPRVRSSDAVFFKRACLSLCTSRNASRDDTNTLDFATAYASCLFGVASLPQFAEAFGCKPGDPMWTINSCCVD